MPKENGERVNFVEPDDNPSVYKRIIEAEAEIAKPIFSIGIKYPEGRSGGSAACDMLAEVLFGECQEFYSELYESNLVTGIRNYYEYGRTDAHFALSGESADPMKVFNMVLDYAKKIRENGLPRDAVEREKRLAYADVLREFDSSEDVAEGLFDAFLANENYLDAADIYHSVTYDEINELAKTVLQEDRFCMSVVYPIGYERSAE